MQQNRRFHRTPFTSQGAEIFCAGGFSVAVVASPELAAFIMRACNRYDALLAIYDLCRGRHDNLTQPHTSPHDRAFDALAKQFDADISANGR